MAKSELLFLAVLASLPVQLGKFFFLDHSYVLGLPIDYRAATIYFSDIVIVLFLVFALVENSRKLKEIFAHFRQYCLAILIFNIYLVVSSILFSTSKEASYFFTLKVFIFSALSIFCANTLRNKEVRGNSLKVITFSLLWQSLLIIGQFALQGSLGLNFLGERTFDSSTVLIAHSEILGRQLLRPYGTFPHPNVAGAYLSISLIILSGFLVSKLSPQKIFAILSAVLAILLTYSKSAFLVLYFGLLLSGRGARRLLALLSIGAIIAAAILTQISTYQVASVAERLLLSQAALDIALKNPFFGVGSSNFILELSKLNLFSLSETRLLQPVHNVFLLILAENGVIGLMLFITLLLVVTRKLQGRAKTAIFLGMLLYLSVDHFLWTLQQGQLIFWLTIAYFLTETKGSVK